MKATRDLKIILELTEREANQIYIHLNPKYLPNECDKIKNELEKALGYKPIEVDI